MSLNVQKIQPIISDCHKRLNNIGQITPEKVEKLPEIVKQSIRECTPARLKELARVNCFAANEIKSELDKKYGEGNYILIAIGRSISSIAETLGQMGINVKIIPLSGLRRGEVESINEESLNMYRTFLAQKGLSKSDLKKNKDKTYILMDYAHYGRSLYSAEKLLKKDEMLGDAENLVAMPVNDVLGDSYVNKRFNTLFEYSRFKDYSYVGKLDISQLQNVYSQCSPERIPEYQGNITKGLRKLFWFNVFDSLVQKDYTDTVPNREFRAIYKHYLSPEASRNYIKREYKKMHF